MVKRTLHNFESRVSMANQESSLNTESYPCTPGRLCFLAVAPFFSVDCLFGFRFTYLLTFFRIFFDSSYRCFWRCRMTVCSALITRSSIGCQRSFALSPSLCVVQRVRHKEPNREASTFPEHVSVCWKCM